MSFVILELVYGLLLLSLAFEDACGGGFLIKLLAGKEILLHFFELMKESICTNTVDPYTFSHILFSPLLDTFIKCRHGKLSRSGPFYLIWHILRFNAHFLYIPVSYIKLVCSTIMEAFILVPSQDSEIG